MVFANANLQECIYKNGGCEQVFMNRQMQTVINKQSTHRRNPLFVVRVLVFPECVHEEEKERLQIGVPTKLSEDVVHELTEFQHRGKERILWEQPFELPQEVGNFTGRVSKDWLVVIIVGFLDKSALPADGSADLSSPVDRHTSALTDRWE